MNHTDSASTKDHPSSARQYNTRLGLILFAIYSLVYLAFVLINAFNADAMETIVVAGLNLAIVYGFLLIIFAFVLAMIYGVMCRSEPSAPPAKPAENVGKVEAAGHGQHTDKREDTQ